jgi:hypothetical protein
MNESNFSTKQEDEIFCPECGQAIKRNAVICVNCGIQVKALKKEGEIIVDNPYKEVPSTTEAHAKNKTSAIILAIFVGFFAWLYTYKKSAWKFWLALGITIVFTIIYYTIFPIPLIIVGIGIFLWVIIDTAIKPNSFFTNYPNE